MSQKGADPTLKRQLAASGQALKRQTSQILPPPSPPPPPPMSQKGTNQPAEEEQHLATMQSQPLDKEESVPIRVVGTVQEKIVSYCNCV